MTDADRAEEERLRGQLVEVQTMSRERVAELYEIAGRVYEEGAEYTEAEEALAELYDPPILNGVHYGYPSCCILSFAAGRTMVGASKEHGIPSDSFLEHFGTAWIPCRECSDRITRVRVAEQASRRRREAQADLPQHPPRQVDGLPSDAWHLP